jgi:Family of unknown function (DUF5926)/SEC-C motif
VSRRTANRTASRAARRARPVPEGEIDPKAPCPCGSGRRYKSCHGAGDVPVARPFEGLPGECDWVAMRELVPSATAPLTVRDSDREVTLATLLPLALPAIVRSDGRVLLGLQVHARSGDVSRDLAHVLEQALDAEPGTMVSTTGLPGPGPRLQDLLDTGAPVEPTVHGDFGFWLEGSTSDDPEVNASMERANATVVPTVRLAAEVGAAYWCRIGDKAHLRWVVPYEEDALLDALARLGAASTLALGEDTRYAGSFRAHGLLVPVWDLPVEPSAGQWEQPAAGFAGRLAEALAATDPLTSAERRARDGLRGRQLTLR